MSRDFLGLSSDTNTENFQKVLSESGWKARPKAIDGEVLVEKLLTDPFGLVAKVGYLFTQFLEPLGNTYREPWLRVVNFLFNYEELVYPYNELIAFLSKPDPLERDSADSLCISYPGSNNYFPTRSSIATEQALTALRTELVLKIISNIGNPDVILTKYKGTVYEYDISKFTDILEIEGARKFKAFYSDLGIEIEIEAGDSNNSKHICISGAKVLDLAASYAKGLAVLISSHAPVIGSLKVDYELKDFTQDIVAFSETLKDYFKAHKSFGVLVHGEPGTGKTSWVETFAKQVLVPEGYTIFILDHQAVEDFVPPHFLKKIAIIVNEVDNLALDRELLSHSSKTEHVLQLLDGRLSNTVVSSNNPHTKDVIVLMTANKIKRLDPAMLRKGRLDFKHEFTTKYAISEEDVALMLFEKSEEFDINAFITEELNIEEILSQVDLNVEMSNLDLQKIDGLLIDLFREEVRARV